MKELINNVPYVNGAPVPFEEGHFCEVDEDEFNKCTECGEQLEANEDGYGTTHGTCNHCIENYCDFDD